MHHRGAAGWAGHGQDSGWQEVQQSVGLCGRAPPDFAWAALSRPFLQPQSLPVVPPCPPSAMLVSAAARAAAAVPRTAVARAMSSRVEPMNADTLHAIGSRRIFSEDHDMFRESCRKWWEAEVVPHHAAVRAAGIAARSAVPHARCCPPRAVGGAGQRAQGAVVQCRGERAAGRHDA